MLTKISVAFIAVALMLGYLGPVTFKLKDVALSIVIVIGIVFMLVDLWHSLQKPED